MVKPLLITSLLLTLLGLMLPVNAQRTGPGCGPTDGWCQPGMGGQSPYGRICTRDRAGRLSILLAKVI